MNEMILSMVGFAPEFGFVIDSAVHECTRCRHWQIHHQSMLSQQTYSFLDKPYDEW